MRKFLAAATLVALCAASALAQNTQAPTLRIVSEDGNRLPSDLLYGNTRVKPLRLRPGTNTPITIDDSDFFVQQQYVDFLSRFPDPSGFAFWQGEINQCATAGCREVKRVNVSAAFFRSIEFQETGLFVYNAHKAAFGDLPNRPVPVRRETFMPETRGIANGVVVGVGEWRRQLDDNKVAYTRAFVQRGEFVAKYPTSLSAAAYVDALFATAGVTPSAADRQNAVNAYNAGADAVASRAAALRSVVESQSLTSAEFNKAFVLMQYFGYLKRNPDDLPDANFDGYRFWLGKLNQFGGDFVRAEMVKAFIASDEYRSRF
jgi:hypothetical protein